MTEGLAIAIDYVFQSMQLHRIMANYMPRNQRSAKLLKRLDFTVEGYARDYLMIQGQWEDHILTSRLNPAKVQPLIAATDAFSNRPQSHDKHWWEM